MAWQTPHIQCDLKRLYAKYRHTANIDDKGQFFSQDCLQICRPNPSFSAKNRDTIVGYLHQVADKTMVFESDANGRRQRTDDSSKKSLYTIRPLGAAEAVDFATDAITAPAGVTSEELRIRAEAEGWQGMRVDLWDSEADALLVKVQYWWRWEDEHWVQILHDILYIGPRDGTEGLDGNVLE